MHIETITINLRNILITQMLVLLAFTENAAVVQQELLRIWKTLKAPLRLIKSTKTNRRSNKFWEIDMTKLEP